jgi:hypothetical protein
MDLGKAPEQGTIALIVITALITGLLVNVVGKRFTESLLELILSPFNALYEAVYRWIAPRNPFSISIHFYRRHVLRSNLARMENPVGPSLEVPLEHAFAPVKVRSNAAQESVDLFAYTAKIRRCMILGGQGTGKTTLMKSLVISVIRKMCHEDLNGLIPVFVVLRNLAKQQQTIQQAIVTALADHHFPGAENFVESSLDGGKLIIVLDGLDEVGANREFVADQILSFCRYDDQRQHQNRLLVTCREHSYKSLDLHDGIPEILQVEPFTNHHMRVFLEGWPAHRGRSAIALYGLIQGDPQIRDICRNPLLLTILTGLYLDTDEFQIPSSRELFYQNTADELLLRRPARRQIKQQFDVNEKRQILERVALDRLETVASAEDPEELTQESLRQKAQEVLRNDKFDFNALIKEIVEINGIIKPAHEDSYSFAHRTILEYFAAREALRSRETWKVVVSFGERAELIEVLYFYCGLLKNLPALATIVEAFAKQKRWLEASRSLLFMTEPPNGILVDKVTAQLHKMIVDGVEVNASLEALSSLANRRDSEFQVARELFAEAIDQLASRDEAGASTLESAIATSPEIALKLIPSLLKHHSERWRAAGVQLLRDIGTAEALDKLVQLLRDEDPYVRRIAGSVLAGMIKTRNRELRHRAALLPERRDTTVWPLDAYFPGKVAIPIAESLAPGGTSDCEAINHAIFALDSRGKGSNTAILKKWQRIPIDAALQDYRRRGGALLSSVASFISVIIIIVTIILSLFSYFSGRAILIQLSSPYVTTIDSRLISLIIEKAEIVKTKLKVHTRPVCTGGLEAFLGIGLVARQYLKKKMKPLPG